MTQMESKPAYVGHIAGSWGQTGTQAKTQKSLSDRIDDAVTAANKTVGDCVGEKIGHRVRAVVLQTLEEIGPLSTSEATELLSELTGVVTEAAETLLAGYRREGLSDSGQPLPGADPLPEPDDGVTQNAPEQEKQNSYRDSPTRPCKKYDLEQILRNRGFEGRYTKNVAYIETEAYQSGAGKICAIFGLTGEDYEAEVKSAEVRSTDGVLLRKCNSPTIRAVDSMMYLYAEKKNA